MEEHNDNLVTVFGRLREAGLKPKPKQCRFAQQEVKYLCHVVSISADPTKLEAAKSFAPPTDVKSLRSFLGLASYSRKFIPKFSKVASPLHSLTKKNAICTWTPACQKSFNQLKQLLTEAPLLAFPNFESPFLLKTDALLQGLGAVLAQRQENGSVRPVAYSSQGLQPHERRHVITELEGLGVVWALKQFRPYLYGRHCDLFTDHEALKSLLNTPQLFGKLA